jgi:hypothetical protein
MNSNSDTITLTVPKLRDNGSNWADYLPRLQNAMGAKGLWRHVEETATVPVPFAITNGIPMLSDGKMPATEDQIDAKESKIIDFEKREYLVRHILLSTTLSYTIFLLSSFCVLLRSPTLPPTIYFTSLFLPLLFNIIQLLLHAFPLTSPTSTSDRLF